jgi:hypothetical protein
MHKGSQKCYISLSNGDETPGAISFKFKSIIHMVNFINSVKFDHCSFKRLNLARVYKFIIFPCLTLQLIQQG